MAIDDPTNTQSLTQERKRMLDDRVVGFAARLVFVVKRLQRLCMLEGPVQPDRRRNIGDQEENFFCFLDARARFGRQVAARIDARAGHDQVTTCGSVRCSRNAHRGGGPNECMMCVSGMLTAALAISSTISVWILFLSLDFSESACSTVSSAAMLMAAAIFGSL